MTKPARRPWGSGTIVQRGKDKYLIRWSIGTDPFTGKQVRRAETLHGVTKARPIELDSLFVLRRQSRARIRDRRRKVWCGECGERIYSTDEWEDLITPNGYLLRHKQCPTERTHHD